jgi:SNF2 family DNA or RNA helicase
VTLLRARQRAGADFALARKGSLIAARVGKGKSLTALAVACDSEARLVLVLCPCSVVGVWRREVAKHCPGWGEVVVLTGSSLAKADQLRQALGLAAARRERVMIVLNYEAAWRKDISQALLGQLWDLLILDESQRVKAPGGKASRFAWKLSKQSRRRIALSGTPTPHSPLDIYAQARALDQTVFGTSFVAFRSRYAVIDNRFGFPKLLGWQNANELRDKLNSFTYWDMGEDDLDLPPVTEQIIPVELGAKGRRAYRQMEREFYAEVESGTVTAANALSRLLRLQQITSGVLPLDDGGEEQVDTAKFDALADLLEDLPKPVVCFGRFHHDLDTIAAAADKNSLVYHEVSGRLKNGLTPHAEMLPETEVLGVQVQSGGLGIDLTRACTAVWVSLGYSLGDFLQCQGRLHRPGQKRHVHFLYLLASGTIDEAVMAALEAKLNVVETVVMGRHRAKAA